MVGLGLYLNVFGSEYRVLFWAFEDFFFKKNHSEGHPRHDEVLRHSEGLPCHGEAEGPKRPPLGFAKA